MILYKRATTNWRTKWKIDLLTLCAQHESGLCIKFNNREEVKASINGVLPENLKWRTNPKLLFDLMQQAYELITNELDKGENHVH